MSATIYTAAVDGWVLYYLEMTLYLVRLKCIPESGWGCLPVFNQQCMIWMVDTERMKWYPSLEPGRELRLRPREH